MIKLFSALILYLFILNLTSCAQQEQINSMDMKEFVNKYQTDSSIIVLDVRTEPELSGSLGRLERIVHIPVQELGTRIDELEKYKSKQIAVICRSGNRSALAAQILKSEGFNAVNVEGGMIQYRKLSNQ
jgi:rhodanese-related sulfurtransferase